MKESDFAFFGRRFNSNGGKSVPEGFEYNSETNPWKLTIEDAREMVEGLGAGSRELND